MLLLQKIYTVRLYTVLFFLLLSISSLAQTISQKLQKAYQQFEADSQLKYSISSLYVIDAGTGQVLFDKNSKIGLAPASTQKIITAATAFELLGKDYRYKTVLAYDNSPVDLKNGKLNNRLYIDGYGDPTLGSFRFKNEYFLDSLFYYIKKEGIDTLGAGLFPVISHFETNSIPDGWIWQDIGNYYGAGHWPINWKENQFDVVMKSSSQTGQKVDIVDKVPVIPEYGLISNVLSAEKGTGDNAYVYLPVGSIFGKIRGTIPRDENGFKVSASVPNPPLLFLEETRNFLTGKGIVFKEKGQVAVNSYPEVFEPELLGKVLYTHYSPSLDSIIYWFLQRSINLYGEALIKTIAYENTENPKFGSIGLGTEIIQQLWKEKGIDENELHMFDGSGLSPQNRVTTHAQVEILKYAKKRLWYPYFYHAMPEYNGMKMKSGTIKNVKGFCGYHKAANGKEYIFSFLVNNYNGGSSALVNKMYKVLDILK